VKTSIHGYDKSEGEDGPPITNKNKKFPSGYFGTFLSPQMDGQDFLSTTRPGPGYADLKKLPMVISESCPYVGAID